MIGFRNFGSAVADEQTPPLGVIDIGSNSVRLVVYEGGRRAPATLYNEKVTCGLGRSLALNGHLDDDAMASSLAALSRFRILAANMGVAALDAVATAAVREAANSAEYLARAEEALDSKIDVLSGAQEAHMAACGVQFGMPDADGIVGDLGGGSLELISLAQGKIGHGETTPLGALRLSVMDKSAAEITSHIDKILEQTDIVAQMEGRTLYAVGGTWRALARLHMEKIKYPLIIIEGFELDTDDALDLANDVQRSSPEKLDKFDAVSTSRLKTLPFGALVLQRLIMAGKPSRIVFSSHGLRDGVLLNRLPSEISDDDPLIAACLDMAGQRSRSLEFVSELPDWIDPLFSHSVASNTPNHRRLRRASCLLSDITWRVNPDYRAERALELLTIASFAGIDHPGRAFLALSVFHRHEHRLKYREAVKIASLLGASAQQEARRIGTAIRLANTLSAETPGIISRTKLAYDGNIVELTLPSDLAALAGPRLEKHLGHMASTLDAEGRVLVDV